MKLNKFYVLTSIIITFVATASFATLQNAENRHRPTMKDAIDSASLPPEAKPPNPGLLLLKEAPSKPLLIADRANVMKRVKLATATPNVPEAALQNSAYEFSPVVEGIQVVNEFIVQNKGNAPLIIVKVKTD